MLAIDPNSEVTSLLPNKRHSETDGTFWWSPLKLRANRTLKISLDTVGFEFFAKAPHGATKIRVIVTKDKPLKLRFNKAMVSQLQTKGVPSLGFSKGAGVRFGQPPSGKTNRGQAPVPANVTEGSLQNLLQPNDWATAEWTFLTRERQVR